mmetsp:Transcript_6300/g.8416  ORF Transcript_6300/g.8416 Transcript_6300/m.8416 type:complete len:110 (+) Transcript_6300:197-526(+)
MRWCSIEDFDVGPEPNPKSRFFKTTATVNDVKHFADKIHCVADPKDMTMYGNYQTGEASAFQVVFELCDPEKNKQRTETEDIVCADENKIREWMKSRFLITVENSSRFI